mgnify:CR=1 FL=1
MTHAGKTIGNTKSTSTSVGQQIKKNDLVIVYNNVRKPPNLAIVIEVIDGWCKIVYTNGEASRIKPEPFWMCRDMIELYGGSDDQRAKS